MGVVTETARRATDAQDEAKAAGEAATPDSTSGSAADPFSMEWDTSKIKMDAEAADFALSFALVASSLFGGR